MTDHATCVYLALFRGRCSLKSAVSPAEADAMMMMMESSSVFPAVGTMR